MKPTNSNDKKCEATGSGCVIWDGPDIECVGICKGDTVTKVVYALGQRVCELEAALDISDLDFSCLVSQTGARTLTLKELLAALITKACSVNT